MKKYCLIGHTGFVGAHLSKQANFTVKVNSSNVSDIFGKSFDTIVCAAAPGSMFEANKFPERDLNNIQSLMDALSQVYSRNFILVSSVAVLRNFSSSVGEETAEYQTDLAYGRNRRILEQFCESTFENSLIVRLPSLFGLGLRKNFIFDLINPVPSILTEDRFNLVSSTLGSFYSKSLCNLYKFDARNNFFKIDREALLVDPQRSFLEEALISQGLSAMQFHNPNSSYQYYDLSRLWADILIAKMANLSYLHLATEPITASKIHKHLTGRNMLASPAALHHEDMRTNFSHLWKKSGDYLYDAEMTLSNLSNFIAGERDKK